MANVSPDIYQLKITLKYIKPPIWRRIQVPNNFTFKQLHHCIIKAMGWRDTHCHEFRTKSISIGSPNELTAEFSDVLDETSLKISSYFKKPKDSIKYLYDFGDGWEHDVLFEKIVPAALGKKYPICVAGKRACPPEDVGGICGYQEQLEIMADPNNSEYTETKEWLEERGISDWNPESFDFKAVVF